MSDKVLQHLLSARTDIQARLVEFVSIPSVGADPAYDQGMYDARRFLVERLQAMGLDNVRELTGEGQACVYADWLHAPGKPTFLVYGHYDVQPPAPLEKWQTPPFEPTVRNERLYARGASDDKGPSLTALETLGGFLAVEGSLPVNVKILLEGEEETGSASLPGILARNKELLAADAIISADGARWRADLPTINVGSRGNAGFEFKVTTGVKDLHSGRYGGAVPNALHVMARLIASLHDDSGRIAVAGYLDPVAPPNQAERAMMAGIPFDDDGFYAALDTAPWGEPGFSTLERLWVRPTVEVNGMWGGYTGAGGKTVIANEAFAKITLRLVPGQDPVQAQAAVIAHLQQHCPPGARLSVTSERGASAAYLVPEDHPLLLAAEEALGQVASARPLRVRMGASLPLTDIVARYLGIDTIMFSFATSDEDYHAPNEFFRLSSIDAGLAGWTALLRILGTHKPEQYRPYRHPV